MVMNGEERVTLERASELLLNHSKSIEETLLCSVTDCGGRLLAEDITADEDQPPFDRTPVDGYACKSSDIMNASRENPVTLEVIEEIYAGGCPSRTIGTGQAARIMTGAPVPPGADCCVYQEDTDYGDARVAVYAGCPQYGNYCFQGEDIRKGTLVLKKGMRLSYVEAGILSGLGRKEILVRRRLRAAVLASGDELMEPGQPLSPGKIYDSNLYLLTARLKELGIEAVVSRRIPDREGEMAEAVLHASKQADLVITTGGVSVGKRDIMHQALRLCGATRLFWKILMKPGMPTIGSVINGTPIISLSGNPFGALAGFELLCRPIFEAMTGDSCFGLTRMEAVLSQGFYKPSPSRRFIRGRYEHGTVKIPEVKKHASGILSSMSGCNCLVDLAAGSEKVEAGNLVGLFYL